MEGIDVNKMCISCALVSGGVIVPALSCCVRGVFDHFFLLSLVCWGGGRFACVVFIVYVKLLPLLKLICNRYLL